ncbi:c-type cytochrome [Microbulbifer pacificus]|uniref:Cytochrome c-551 n=1 Tax=Microbulbifer pacificus TaxID=407164 RepID=A0AAU0MX18_9GAMM|nr:c-type cytochrome [Microbulbifer pacificus]WOX04741.1 c-type cytochrome [Microbulbifer pacificus]
MFNSPDAFTRSLCVLFVTAALTACGEGRDENAEAATITPPVASPWQSNYLEIGRTASPAELAAWDIDVRPDFTGLPPGSGNAEQGEEIWLARCAACHGDFGDSNQFFSPLVLGNVTPQDIESGHVAALKDPTRVRTTLMKVATVSTLWDYINRAMPWNDPKSLSTDEVYSLVAYLLSLGYIVDSDFELSNENIANVQARMPNRNGMTQEHGLWKVDDVSDVHNTACMTNCEASVEVASSIPQFARNAHGNLRDQMRIFGPFPGEDTGAERGAETAIASVAKEPPAPEAGLASSAPMELLTGNSCLGCHQIDSKLVGPAFTAVAEKYAGQDDAVVYLSRKIRQGGSGVWGGFMPPMAQLSEANAEEIARWLAQ